MKKKWLIMFISILTIFAVSTTVMADDDDDDDHGKYEYYEKSKHHDDEEGDDEEKWNAVEQVPLVTEYWNIWSREARNNPNNLLPITEAGETTVWIGNQETSLYFIPQDGQLLVSGTAMADLLGGDSTYYSQSKICILTNGKHELIVRAGFNVAYEDRVKTPMPILAKAYEKSVYLPVSVAANALGYRVAWDAAKQAFIFQPI